MRIGALSDINVVYQLEKLGSYRRSSRNIESNELSSNCLRIYAEIGGDSGERPTLFVEPGCMLGLSVAEFSDGLDGDRFLDAAGLAFQILA